MGVFKGPNPFDLKPLEEWDNAGEASNPILSCANIKDPFKFVADPFLHIKSKSEWWVRGKRARHAQ